MLTLDGNSRADEAVVTVEYRDKPPYSYTKDGKPAGFPIERTTEVFKRDIQDNASAIGSPSWYQLPERELYARFSLPIHQDKPTCAGGGSHVIYAAVLH